MEFEEFANPLRVGLWIDVTGEAPSLSDAVETYGNVTRGLTAILSLAANVAIAEPTAEVAIETTATATKREYWARQGSGWNVPAGSGRWIRPMLVETLVSAVAACPPDKQDRFQRSITHYHHAIQNWVPGSEIAALNHIWIGSEALTKLIRDKLLADLGFTTLEQMREHYSQLLTQEQGKTVTLKRDNDLDGELRRRYIFQGDDAIYKFAKDASNMYEHSYTPLWEVRDQALQSLEAATKYLREAIIDYAGIDSKAKADLLNDYYQMPYDSTLRMTLGGEFRGTPKDLDAIEIYPYIEWEHIPLQNGVDEEGDAIVGYGTRVASISLPGEATFQPLDYQLFASPAMAEGHAILMGANREAIQDTSTTQPWSTTTEAGRSVAGFQMRDIFDQAIHTVGGEVISFDETSKFLVQLITSDDKIDNESILRNVESLRTRLAAEGWKPLCVLPMNEERRISIVFQRPKVEQGE
jgi:hypothetical protein